MARAIMIQGTCSGAGKSLLTAALCRIFRQDGYTVAPFKAQNMALNSFITAEGLEMGRAQVTQAEAAGIAPSVLMNPVLLKPSSDTGSQVIVNGEVMGEMSAADYFKTKRTLVPQIMRAYETLAAQYDIIVLEGAGSPAEINLKADDLVNMGMARRAGAPVLLAGDIDRGGVFAALAGTNLLLEPDERAMIKGFLINKFRGDRAILQSGLDMIEQITGVPVVGVVPWMRVDLEDEDSLSDRLNRKIVPKQIDIAVVRLPRISNFTDFDPLERISGVSLRYISDPAELGNPALVILPGSKSTMSDLLWMRQNGLESAVKKFAGAGGTVLGICGGYQMLGKSLRDPEGIEQGGELAGMGLLPVSTVFTRQKIRTQVSGRLCEIGGALSALSGAAVTGYEIHMGETVSTAPLIQLQKINGEKIERSDGTQAGNIYGTYLHGVFECAELSAALMNALCRIKGVSLDTGAMTSAAVHREQQYDLLAKTVRETVDLAQIYRILEAGI